MVTSPQSTIQISKELKVQVNLAQITLQQMQLDLQDTTMLGTLLPTNMDLLDRVRITLDLVLDIVPPRDLAAQTILQLESILLTVQPIPPGLLITTTLVLLTLLLPQAMAIPHHQDTRHSNLQGTQ